MKPIVVEWTKN